MSSNVSHHHEAVVPSSCCDQYRALSSLRLRTSLWLSVRVCVVHGGGKGVRGRAMCPLVMMKSTAHTASLRRTPPVSADGVIAYLRVSSRESRVTSTCGGRGRGETERRARAELNTGHCIRESEDDDTFVLQCVDESALPPHHSPTHMSACPRLGHLLQVRLQLW